MSSQNPHPSVPSNLTVADEPRPLHGWKQLGEQLNTLSELMAQLAMFISARDETRPPGLNLVVEQLDMLNELQRQIRTTLAMAYPSDPDSMSLPEGSVLNHS